MNPPCQCPEGSSGSFSVDALTRVFVIEVAMAPGSQFELRRGGPGGGCLMVHHRPLRYFAAESAQDWIALPGAGFDWASADPEARVTFHTTDQIAPGQSREEYLLALLTPEERRRVYRTAEDAEERNSSSAVVPALPPVHDEPAAEIKVDYPLRAAERWVSLYPAALPPSFYDGLAVIKDDCEKAFDFIRGRIEESRPGAGLEERAAAHKAQHLADFDRPRTTDRKPPPAT